MVPWERVRMCGSKLIHQPFRSSFTPEDAYHNASLLSKISRAEKKAAIHVFYGPPLWNIDPLPTGLKDNLIPRAGWEFSVRRVTLPQGSFPRICCAISRRHSRFPPQIPRYGPPRSPFCPSRRLSSMLVATTDPFRHVAGPCIFLTENSRAPGLPYHRRFHSWIGAACF